MPEVFHPSKRLCLRLDEGSFSCFEIFGHVAFVPISGWKRWEEFAEQDGPEGPVNLLPRKRSWRCCHVFDVVPVDEEAVMAVIRVDRVLRLDETREELDVGIF